MTPKEKALTLCQSFGMTTFMDEECNDGVTLPINIAKKCALIAVDEILQINWYHSEPMFFDDLANEFKEKSVYWNEVKQEIEKL